MANSTFKFLAVAFLLISFTVNAQNNMGSVNRLTSFAQVYNADTILNSIAFRNVGPSVMSGRVVDIEINPNNTTEMYAAYASGGVFYSNNNGMSFTPVFDKQASITIGDIAVDWVNKIIWVGTGECNSSRSSYAGTGVYKSADSGKTWQHLGLENTQHISKIVLNPSNKNIAYISSIGPLYTQATYSCGIFKTVDGGKNWQNITTNYIPKNIGVIDMMVDAVDENTIYAAACQRSRTAWQFDGQGKESAIFKSKDAGKTWSCITGSNSGLPKNDGVGRIGIAQCKTKPNILYALIDNQNRQSADKIKKNELTALQIKEMTEVEFLALSEKKVNTYLRNNDYPEKYTAKSIFTDIKNKKITVVEIADWKLSDGDAALFQTPVIGAELYKSTNGGETWAKTHEQLLEGLYFTYGYYFGTIAVHPTNDSIVNVAGYTLLQTTNGGKTFKEIAKDNCHADYHRIWINPANPKHIVVANDGGINISYDNGNKWFKGNNPAVAQCYAIAVDNAKPYHVYAGLQDNGTWMGPSNYTDNEAWHQSGQNPYKEIGGGDGMQIQVDNRDNTTIYTGYQFGFYNRGNTANENEMKAIHPTYNIGEKPLRYNWQTPILLSKHNQDILYMGSNCFHRSMNKGDSITKLSEDLTTTTNKGNVPFGTITTISESPIQFGLLYCGTDDGNIWMSTDVGNSFSKININNKQLWVSRIVASQYKVGRVYAALNGYRNDDFTPYLYISENFGKTWMPIASNLPAEPINVIREDNKKENIIYVGTDNGLYISTNNGKNYKAWQSNLPRVAVHDIAIQSRENEIVLGTHGRSIYIASLKNIQLLDSLRNQQLAMYAIAKTKAADNWGNAWATYAKPVEPAIAIDFYTEKASNYTLQITNDKKEIVFATTEKSKAGFNTYTYHAQNNTLLKNKNSYYIGDNKTKYLQAGKYVVKIILDSKETKTEELIIEQKED